VAAGETFADDLGGEAKVCATFAAAEMGSVPGKEFALWGNDGGGVQIG
jgi:hypothetical protein